MEFTDEELKQSYRLLDLAPGATPEEVKEAYRDLIRIWHPDKYHDEPERVRRRAEEKFRELTEAYRMLQQVTSAEQPTPGLDLVLRSQAPTIEYAGTGASIVEDPGLQPVKFGDRYGYVSRSGRLVIQPRFEFADNFFEGLARVEEKRRTGFVNASGEWVVSPVFDSGGRFSEGLAMVKYAGRCGYVDRGGRVVVTPQFDTGGPFQSGLAVVSKGGKFGYIKQDGSLAIPAIYDAAEGFSRGKARVRLADKWGRVTPDGEFFVDMR